MATINIDTSAARSNVAGLNSTLEQTADNLDAASKSSSRLEDALKNAGRAAEDATDGIESADVMMDALGKSAEQVGGIAGGAIKETLPNLQKALQGTSFSFRTLGKAIAATGIGLLIQGAVLLVANFKDVVAWVKAFGQAIGDTMPGVSRFINFVTNFTKNLTNWFKGLVGRLGSSKIGQWLGLDKLVDKFKNIKSAADFATNSIKGAETATTNYANAATKAVEKIDRSATPQTAAISGTSSGALSRASGLARVTGKSATMKQKEEQDLLNKATEKAIELDIKRREEAEKTLEYTNEQIDAQKQLIASQMNGIATIAGALGSMVEENSAAYKALMTVQIVATTAAGAMTAFTAADNPTMAQKWISFGAIIATGVAQLHSLYSQKIDDGGSGTTATAPTLSAPMPSMQLATAQMANAGGQQVYITEKQLDTERANNVKLVKNTVF